MKVYLFFVLNSFLLKSTIKFIKSKVFFLKKIISVAQYYLFSLMLITLIHVHIHTSEAQLALTEENMLHSHILQIHTAKHLKRRLVIGLHAPLIQQLLEANLMLHHHTEMRQNHHLRLAQSNAVSARPMWMMIIHLESDT